MNSGQKAVVVGGGILGAGTLVAYFALHEKAQGAKLISNELVNFKEGFTALATAQMVTLYQQFPLYPHPSFGIWFPVTRFRIADAVWQTWLQTISDEGDAGTALYLIQALQTISDEIAGRLHAPNVNWEVLLTFRNPMIPTPTLEALFGDAARATPTLDFFTELEAEQFWVSLVNAAKMLDARKLYKTDFWGLVVHSLRGFADEFQNLPDQYGAAAQWVGSWLGQAASKVIGGGIGGFFRGLMSSAVTPVLVLGAIGGGGYYAYRKFGGSSHKALPAPSTP